MLPFFSIANIPLCLLTASRWKLMLRECPLNSHEVSNFQDKVSFLLEFYREALSSGRSLRASSGRKRKFDSSVEFPPVPSNADIFGDSGDDDSEEEQLLEEGAAALSSNRATSVPTSQTSLAGLFVNPIILQQQQVTEEERIQEQLKHPKKRKLVENREAVESRSQAAAPSAQVESITVETSRSSIKEDVIDEEEEQVDQDEVDNTSQPKKHKKHKEHKHDKKEKKSKKDKKDKKHKKDKDRHHDEA